MTLFQVVNKAEELSSKGLLGAAVAAYMDWLATSTTDQHLRYAAFFNLGTLLQRVGKLDEAAVAYQEALKLKPNFPEASTNLGLVLAAKNNATSADGRKTVPLPEVINKADVLTSQGKLDEAIECYRHWLENSPSELHAHYVALFNMGVMLRDAGRLDEAIVAYQRALAVKPDFYQGAVNLGSAYEAKNRNQEAISIWKNALTTNDPEGQVSLLNQLGRVLEIEKSYQEAEEYLKRSLIAKSEQPDVIHHYLYLRQKQCKWPVVQSLPGISKDFLLKHSGPLGILALAEDPAVQFKIIKSWIARKVPRNLPRLSPEPGHYKHDKIRIGYMSCDFRWHAVSILTAELFEKHNRDRFEIYGIDFTVEDGGAMRKRVLKAMDHHLPIHALSDKQAAELIRQHEIDILVDLTGLTSGARPAILAYKPAPIQVSYLGFVGTCGMPEVDYILADRFVFPKELAKDFVEKPLYLPEVYQANDSTREIGTRPSRESCKLPSDAFVYCSFNGNYKITSEVFAVWMRILKRVPKSVLWLIADNEWAQNNLRDAAKAQGIEVDRLIFAGRVPPADYLARYQVADLLLDTSPYNAGTTASDALWAGLPVLTCPGKAFAARMAGSLLNSLGLNDLIAKNWKDYEDIAVRLAKNPGDLDDCKQRLEKVKRSSSLFDSGKFVHELEEVLLSLHADSSVKEKDAPKKKKAVAKKKTKGK